MRVVRLPGVTLELHLVGADTGGSLCLCVDHPEPGFRLIPHRHRDEDESIHILEGTFEFMLDGETRQLGPGDTVHVPRGTLHGIANVGEEVGKRVLAFHPAGIERFFLGAAELSDPAEIAALAMDLGWEFA